VLMPKTTPMTIDSTRKIVAALDMLPMTDPPRHHPQARPAESLPTA
jgi:hypothetical protein